MLGCVGQCLLHNSICSRLYLGLKTSINVSMFETYHNARLGRISFKKPKKGREQTKLVEVGGAQIEGAPPNRPMIVSTDASPFDFNSKRSPVSNWPISSWSSPARWRRSASCTSRSRLETACKDASTRLRAVISRSIVQSSVLLAGGVTVTLTTRT